MRLLFVFIFIFNVVYADSIIDPIPHPNGKLSEIERIGKELFFDSTLSPTQKFSCNTCHNLKMWGTRNEAHVVGADGKKTQYNVPSILNLRYQYAYSWQNRIYSLKGMIKAMLLDPNKMAVTESSLQKYLQVHPKIGYRLEQILGRSDIDAVSMALEAYLLRLVTPDSKFDRYIRGEIELSKEESEGYTLFKRFGCIACHNGKAVGGHIYYQYGYFSKGKKIEVKCPSLRNVEKTYPYFHNGSVKTLQEAVWLMGKVQLGRDIAKEDIEKIVAFLKTLTGRIDD